MARIILTTNPTPEDRIGQLALYNGMDNLTLYEIAEGIQAELRPEHKAVYEFEMDLHSALIEMAFAGIPVDVERRDELIRTNEAERHRIGTRIHQLCEAIGYYDYYLGIASTRYEIALGSPTTLPKSWDEWLAIPITTRKAWKLKAGPGATKAFQDALKASTTPFNPDSSKQKIQLFYHFFGIDTNEVSEVLFSDFPPPWGRTKGLREIRTRSVNGTYTPSADRDCLEKLGLRASSDQSLAAYWALPFINLCLYYADLSKTLQFLRCKLDKGVFYSSFSPATETGRLSSRKSNFGGLGWNAQNITPPLRIIFTTPTGWKAATPDFEQIESRMVAARCFTQFGAVRYLAATECGDLHSLACSMVWEDLPWPEDFTVEWTIRHGPFPKDMISAAKRLAKVEAYRGKSRRDLSKTLGHGSNYWGKPPNMSKQSHIDLGLVQHYQDVYFSVFPEIIQWHEWIIEQVQVYSEYHTIFGRPRRFFGRSDDDATIREAIAHDGQSPAADYTNLALLAIHKEALAGRLPCTLFLQKHDEIGVRYREVDEAIVTSRMVELMEQHFTLIAPDGSTRDWYVPAEMLVGWNLAHASDANPDGLVTWRGSDDRTRTNDPFSLDFLKRA